MRLLESCSYDCSALKNYTTVSSQVTTYSQGKAKEVLVTCQLHVRH